MKPTESLSEKDIERRREEALKRMLSTPHQPHKPKSDSKPAKPKKEKAAKTTKP